LSSFPVADCAAGARSWPHALRPGRPLTGAGSRSTQAAVPEWSRTHWAIWSLRVHHTSSWPPQFFQDLQGVHGRAGSSSCCTPTGRVPVACSDRRHAVGDPLFLLQPRSWICRCQLRPCEPPRACGRSRPAMHPRAALVAGYLADARCLTQTSLAQRFRRGRHEAVSGRLPVIGADSPAWRLALSRLMTWSDRTTNRPAATLIKVR
jgi:hypothetical protein